jgi:hypothetical protein
MCPGHVTSPSSQAAKSSSPKEDTKKDVIAIVYALKDEIIRV